MSEIVSHESFYVVRVGRRYAIDRHGNTAAFACAMRIESLADARVHAQRIKMLHCKRATPPEVSVVRITLEEVT